MRKMKIITISLILIVLIINFTPSYSSKTYLGIRMKEQNTDSSLSVASQNDTWDVETLDSDGDVGRGSSLVIDSMGNPHISYYDNNNKCLKYIKWTGSDWKITSLSGPAGAFNSLALDSNDTPHIAYMSYDENNQIILKYAKLVDNRYWYIETVDSDDVGWGVSLVIDENDVAHIGYMKYTVKNDMGVFFPKYAWKTSSSWVWHTEYVEDTFECAFGCTLDIDSEGVPHILYREWIPTEYPWYGGHILKYATKTDTGWVKTPIAEAYYMEFSSFVLDSDDSPHIVYGCCIKSPEHEWEAYDYDMYYAHRVNNNFENIIIDDTHGQLWSASIAIDSYDIPHICYCHQYFSEPNNYELKYATIKDNSWRVELVKSEQISRYAYFNSIGVDEQNTPHISYYYGDPEGGLMYAKKIRDDLPPCKPTIDGPNQGKINKEHEYTFVSNDPDAQDLFYYINWGDGNIEEWIGPFSSNEELKLTHIWNKTDKYIIKVKARDIYGSESSLETLEVSMPKTKAFNISLFFQRFFQRFPLFEKILDQII